MTKTVIKLYKTLISFLLLTIFFSYNIYGQAYQGYTLFAANNSKATYLVNMNNTVVKTWTHSISGNYSYYLLQDGSLMRTANSSNSTLNGGGATGIVQKVAWDGTVTWSYTYSTNTYRSHHDICPMPNGNVLLIAWETKTTAQCVAAGLNRSGNLWPDHIIEVQPVGSTGGNIVWKWHAWDHLIQDFDPTKANYGVVANHPELLDINVGSEQNGDWMHVNGLSYNPELDQIVFSSHTLDEIYVIDHSTTIAEAAGHTGGRWGKGGDILYRWGRPANYRAPGAQVFNVVHCATWVPKGYPGEGNVLVFNNLEGSGASKIMELTPPRDSAGNYIWTPGTAYGPANATWTYSASGFYSNHLGGVQRLPNGNTMISESTSGYLFEVNPAGNTVWSYNRGGEIVRVLRYGNDYPGLGNLFPAAFSVNKKTIDFGTVPLHTPRAENIVIKNNGTGSMNITQIVFTNSEFTSAITAPRTIASKDSLTFPVTFTPSSSGQKSGKLIFTHNGNSLSDTITLTGTGLSAASFLATLKSLSFGSVGVYSNKTESFYVKNTGLGTLTINNIQRTNTADFTVSVSAPVNINAGDSLLINTTFAPQTAGNKLCHLIFSHTGVGGVDTVSLSGKALGALFYSPVNEFSFGINQLSLNKTESIYVKNTGYGNLTITNISSPKGNEFTFSGQLPIIISSGDSAILNITFNPKSLGERTGSIIFNHSGESLSDTLIVSGRGVLLTSFLPKYIQGINGTNANRIPFAYRARIEGLVPNAVYRYFNQIVTSADAANTNGAGNCIFTSQSGNFIRTTGPGMATSGAYGTFNSDNSGTYEGWFINEPTGNARFVPSNYLFMRIALNDGNNGTTVSGRITSADSVQVLKLDTFNNDSCGTGLRGEVFGLPKDFVLLYDNTDGTGRPVSISFIESDGTDNSTANNYAAFYSLSVNGKDSTFGTVIPNNLPNGIRRVEHRSLSDGSVLYYVTDTDGIWSSGANTVNPSGGISEIVLTYSDLNIGTSVNQIKEIPLEYSLKQNYPNPFNPSTVINYSLLNEEHVSIEVFDILGKKISFLVNEIKKPGTYSVSFNAGSMPGGVYIYVMRTAHFVQTRKMLLLK